MWIPGTHATSGRSGGCFGRYSVCMRRRFLLIAALILVSLPVRAEAWGFEVHKYIVGRALTLLPPEIRPFFEKFQTTIVEHSIDRRGTSLTWTRMGRTPSSRCRGPMTKR